MATVGTPGAIQTPPPNATVIGQGITYPPTLDHGRLKLSWGGDLVDQAVTSIANTRPGERVMQPDYGAAVGTFEPIGLELMRARLIEQVAEHEPRAQNITVDAKLGQATGEALIIPTYEVSGEVTPRTLTFPIFEGPS